MRDHGFSVGIEAGDSSVCFTCGIELEYPRRLNPFLWESGLGRWVGLWVDF